MVEEAETRAVARRDDGGVADAIEARVRSRERPVGGVSGLPVVTVVAARRPPDAVALSELAVEPAHARALMPPDVEERETRRERLAEPEAVHPLHDGEAEHGIGGESGLLHEGVGLTRLPVAAGVEADSLLAHPEERAP